MSAGQGTYIFKAVKMVMIPHIDSNVYSSQEAMPILGQV